MNVMWPRVEGECYLLGGVKTPVCVCVFAWKNGGECGSTYFGWLYKALQIKQGASIKDWSVTEVILLCRYTKYATACTIFEKYK